MEGLFNDVFPDLSGLLDRYTSGSGDGEDSDRAPYVTGGNGNGVPDPLVVSTPRKSIPRRIEDSDGRVWQSELVDRTEYSKSTVSEHLSALERADEIVQIRVGKRKVVFPPDHVPEAARHPFSNYVDGVTAATDGGVRTPEGTVEPTEPTEWMAEDGDSSPERPV